MRHGGAVQIGAAMLVWSTWGVFVRRIPVAPWALTAYVGVVSAAAAAAAWGLGGGRARDLWPRADRRLLALMAVLFVVNNVCFLTAYERTTVANAVLTHYTAPVFVAALAPALLGERLLPATPAALAMAAAGMVLLLPEVRIDLGDRHLVGLLLGAVSGAAYGGLILLARVLSLRVAALPLIFFQNALLAVCLAPAAALREPVGDVAALVLIVLLGLVHSTAVPVLYLRGIRRVRAQTAAVLGYLEPVAAVALGAVFLGESPGAAGLVGGALIVGGGSLAAWGEARARKPVDVPEGGR